MKIFILNGQGGVGKDEFKQLVAEELGDRGTVGTTSMIAYAKQVAEKFGWCGGKELKDRKMLSQLKDLLTEWDDSPFVSTCIMVKQMEKDGVTCCFIDAREPEDIKRLQEKFNCQSVLIIRGEKKNYGNHADDLVFSIPYDIQINNSGTLEDLRCAAALFVNSYLIEGNAE